MFKNAKKHSVLVSFLSFYLCILHVYFCNLCVTIDKRMNDNDGYTGIDATMICPLAES